MTGFLNCITALRSCQMVNFSLLTCLQFCCKIFNYSRKSYMRLCGYRWRSYVFTPFDLGSTDFCRLCALGDYRRFAGNPAGVNCPVAETVGRARPCSEVLATFPRSNVGSSYFRAVLRRGTCF